MRDANEGNFDGLEASVEIEVKAGELAGAEFVVDADAGVDFFAGVAVGFEAVFGFEEFDLRGIFVRGSWFGVLGCGLFLLCTGQRGGDDEQKSECERSGNLQHGSAEFAQGALKKILGFKGTAVKNCFSRSFLKSVSPKIGR